MSLGDQILNLCLETKRWDLISIISLRHSASFIFALKLLSSFIFCSDLQSQDSLPQYRQLREGNPTTGYSQPFCSCGCGAVTHPTTRVEQQPRLRRFMSQDRLPAITAGTDCSQSTESHSKNMPFGSYKNKLRVSRSSLQNLREFELPTSNFGVPGCSRLCQGGLLDTDSRHRRRPSPPKSLDIIPTASLARPDASQISSMASRPPVAAPAAAHKASSPAGDVCGLETHHSTVSSSLPTQSFFSSFASSFSSSIYSIHFKRRSTSPSLSKYTSIADSDTNCDDNDVGYSSSKESNSVNHSRSSSPSIASHRDVTSYNNVNNCDRSRTDKNVYKKNTTQSDLSFIDALKPTQAIDDTILQLRDRQRHSTSPAVSEIDKNKRQSAYFQSTNSRVGFSNVVHSDATARSDSDEANRSNPEDAHRSNSEGAHRSCNQPPRRFQDKHNCRCVIGNCGHHYDCQSPGASSLPADYGALRPPQQLRRSLPSPVEGSARHQHQELMKKWQAASATKKYLGPSSN